jgi:tetratricopeptide (TPR) repeat protein
MLRMSNADLGGPQPSILDQAPSERRTEFAQAVMNRGLALFRKGQFDSADVLFETVASEPAVRPQVLHIRGVIALHRGEDDRAMELIEEAIRLNPADSDAHANFGLLLLKVRQQPQALAAYAAALTLRPDNVAAQFGLARALAALALTDPAIDAFRDVIASAPEQVDAAIEFGTVLNDAGRHEEAVAMLRDAIVRHPERAELRTALDAGLRGIADRPAASAEDDRGRSGRQGDAAADASAGEAADPVMAAVSRMTTLPRATDPVICDALFVEACRQHRLNNTDRSKKLFEQVLQLDSGHVNTLCNLGALELGQGAVARALMLLEAAVEQAPTLAPARISLADALMVAKKTEQAHAQYRKAVELAPDSDVVHARLALALQAAGDTDAAMTHFLAAVKINRGQSPAFYEALGRTCAVRGNHEGAEISFKHALALDPQLESAHRALGELYLALERPGDAQASFRRALAIDAADAVALRGIAHASDRSAGHDIS